VIGVRKRALPALGLASCLAGLIASPYGYIAIGALGYFSPAFSLLTLPPLLLATGFLIWRILSKPLDTRTNGALTVIEGIGWMAIVAFLVLISGFSLFTTFERIGLFATIFLLASAISFPLLLLRETALEQRLTKVPRAVSIALLILIVASSGLAMSAFQLIDPAFM
jgi:hypothetical protein